MTSPAVLRGIIGSCLALGVADLAWLDVNAERMTTSAPPALAVPIEPMAAAPRIERLRPLPPPSPGSDEVLAPVIETESHSSPPAQERRVVHFDRGASVLSGDEAKTLTPIANAMKDHPNAVVHIEAHSDRTGWEGSTWEGNRRNNFVLSNERAAAIVRLLSDLGVPRERIRAAAFGDTRPVDDRWTEEAFRRNRRAEVRIELTGDK